MKNSKFYQSMLVIIASAMFFTACPDDKPEPDTVVVNWPNLVSGNLVFEADERVIQVNVETNVKSWDVNTTTPEWIKFGRSGSNLDVKVEKYTDTSKDRTGAITVTAGTAKATVTVTQKKAKKNTLSVEQSSLLFIASQTGFKDVTITTDAESWDATSTATWFSIQKQDKTLKVTVNALNRSAEPRIAYITVTAGNADEVKVEVNQEITRNTLEVAPKFFYYPEGVTGAKSANVVTNADNWEYDVDAEAAKWLDVKKQENKLEVTPKGPNTGISERTAEIKVTAGNAIPVDVTVIQDPVPPVFLRVNPASLLYEAGQTGNKTLTVETNAASWEPTTSSDWFTSQKSGNTIIVNVSSLNNGASQRSANITVTAPGATTVTVPVTQDPTPFLTVDPATPITFAYNEISPAKTATVSTNVASWTFSNNATNWLNVVKNNNTLTINPISANTGTAERTATITITAGTLTATVTVKQAGSNWLSADPANITFGFGETSMKYSTVSTSAASWSYTGSANWLTISQQGDQLRFTPSGLNSTASDRSATISVTATGLPSVPVTVTQVRTILTVSPTPINYTASETGTKTATVTTTADSWSFSNNATTWLNVVKSNNTLSVNPTSVNTGTSDRTATITISAGNQTTSLTVTQARATLSVSPTTFTFTYNETSPAKTATVTTTAASWDFTNNASTWLNVVKNNNTLSINSTSANTSTSQRSATITVTAPGANSVTVTVTQEPQPIPLTVTPGSQTFAAGETGTKTFTVSPSTANWTVSSDASWLSATKPNSTTINATASSLNTGTSDRTATLTVSATGYTSVKVTVTQVRTTLSVTPTSMNFAATETSPAKTATVTTNAASWTFTNNATSWLNVVKNNNTLSINPINANTGTTARTATITVAVGALTATVTVTQAGQPNPGPYPPTGNYTATRSLRMYTKIPTSWTGKITSYANYCSITNFPGDAVFTIRLNYSNNKIYLDESTNIWEGSLVGVTGTYVARLTCGVVYNGGTYSVIMNNPVEIPYNTTTRILDFTKTVNINFGGTIGTVNNLALYVGILYYPKSGSGTAYWHDAASGIKLTITPSASVSAFSDDLISEPVTTSNSVLSIDVSKLIPLEGTVRGTINK